MSWNYLHYTYPALLSDSTLNTARCKQAAVQNDLPHGPGLELHQQCEQPDGGQQSDAGAAGLRADRESGGSSAVARRQRIANEATNDAPDGLVVQNVFLYNLKITQNGLLSFSYSMNGGAFTSVDHAIRTSPPQWRAAGDAAIRLRRLHRR